MSKTLFTLAILGLFVGIALSAGTPTPTPLGSSLSSSVLNSTAVKVFSGANSTDTTDANFVTVPSNAQSMIVYGPGSTNGTIYAYGLVSSATSLSKIYKRALNATLVGYGNDTTEMSVMGTDGLITTTIVVTSGSIMVAVGPGYLAILTNGNDGSSQPQVYLTLVQASGSAASPTTLTKTTGDAAGAQVTAFVLGNVWYDIGSGAFFYAFSRSVATTAGGATTYAYTVLVGGMYVNGTAFWSPLSITATGSSTTAASKISNVVSGGDNWLNSSNVYVAWKDITSSPANTYYTKVSKSIATTTGGSGAVLVADTTKLVYLPIGVWSSNYTYGIACSLVNTTGTPTAYTAVNFLNGTTTGTDSGISYSSTTGAPTGLWGWMLTTGYTLAASWPTATNPAYTIGTFYANGTANMTSTTLSSGIVGGVSFFEDVNGTFWAGWSDPDTANNVFYTGYLAKLQGQVNVASSSSANVLTNILAFVALCLAAIYAF